MLTLTIEGPTAAHLLSEVQLLFPQLQQVACACRTTEGRETTERKPRTTKKSAEQPPEPEPQQAAGERKPDAERTPASAQSAEVPDVDTVRAKLKTLGATDGLGHDKVFEVLGRYGAKNASTVPEARRAELIAEIDGLLADRK